jgi:hypothetical protein
MSPEVFEWDCVSVDGSGRKNVMYNKGADMWSFGVILWQMFSCEAPYSEFKGQSMFAIFNAIKKGHKPKMEDGAFPPRLKVATSCSLSLVRNVCGFLRMLVFFASCL